MKRKVLSLILVLMSAVLCFSGCSLGSYVQNGGNTSSVQRPGRPEEGGSTVTPGEDEPSINDSHYRVDVYTGANNDKFLPGDNVINVVWRNEWDVFRVELGPDGSADAGVLPDGEYSVYLEGLPANYSYNPNGYKADTENRRVAINVTTILSPDSKNSSSDPLYQHYSLIKNGTYRVELKSEYDVVQYAYRPDPNEKAGVYSIVSWVNVYDGEINPYIDVYTGNVQFKVFSRTVDGGAAALDGGYTKNFRHEVRVDESEKGNAFCFAVHASSRLNSYPVTVDFAITREGDYVSNNSDVRGIRANEADYAPGNPRQGEVFTFADLGTREFINGNFRENPDTGRFHRYSMELYGDNPYGFGAGYGPYLLCAITKAIPSYPLTTLFNANSVGGDGISFNYLKLYNVWIESEQKFAVYDYTDFIRTEYRNVCNTDGVCYVTRELKEFLQKFAENHSLYTDHVNSGENTPESLGYTANQDALWLFACGFYERPGQ